MCVMDQKRASRTAVFVCQGRAVADGRLAVRRFGDPIAARLLRPEELADVELARSETNTSDWCRRLAVQALRACAEVVVPRSVAIDDAVTAAANRQVVIVGAGLDSRPWRLDALPGATVVLVDHPASQADARERSDGLAPIARLERVAADLSRAGLDEALNGSHDRTEPTTWIWEGVVPYLTRPEVEATVAAIATRSAPGSVVIVAYQTPSLVGTVGRRLARLAARIAKLDDPLADEPWRSLWSPVAMSGLLGRHGLRVRVDRSLLEVAADIGSPTTHRRSIGSGRVVVADA